MDEKFFFLSCQELVTVRQSRLMNYLTVQDNIFYKDLTQILQE